MLLHIVVCCPELALANHLSVMKFVRAAIFHLPKLFDRDQVEECCQ